jgi:ribonuclease BN (tRNA processing enzyme)
MPGGGGDRLILLGVRGGPLVTGYASTSSASVMVVRGMPFVVDTGYGVSLKLLDAGIPLQSVRQVFITHHHSDHNLELGPLLYNAWAAGLRDQVGVYGPKGLDSLIGAYWASNRFDIETRIADEGRPDVRRLVQPHEYAEGPVMSAGGVSVTALRNLHPPVTESYALKFELGSKTVVFSGDTAYLPRLAEFARGADYLVHEAMYPAALDRLLARRPNAPRLKQSILSHHTTAEDAGRIAAAAGVKTLVLNHFVPGDDPAVTSEMWSAAAAQHFAGHIVVGRPMLTLLL